MNGSGLHRPRNLDWQRAAALLYGDWGTSKAYVIGLGFLAAGYSAFPIIVAVCALTAIVGYNYTIICKHYPDGGGVYSAARMQSRNLAVIGALLLVANFTVTAAMSGWAAMTYFGVPREWVPTATIAVIFLVGIINWFGPKHSGSLAITMAMPMVVIVLFIIALSIPHLSMEHLKPSSLPFSKQWIAFAGVILALSGVEAIANLTGVMKLDANASIDKPRVVSTSRKAIWPVAIEVVFGTILLGWAMLSLPESLAPQLQQRFEDMLRFLAEQYGALALGPAFGKGLGWIVGLIVGLLLLSAVNTAIAALVGLFYMMARDGEMPKPLARLNIYGVPRLPLILAILLPICVVLGAPSLEGLANLYAIGVVGAIAVNLGACTFNFRLGIAWYERTLMGATFLVLFAVELTIAWVKEGALFFAVIVIGVGLGLRAYAQKRAGLRTLTVSEEIARAVAPESLPDFHPNLATGQKIMVAARGLNPVLRFALEEARLRSGALYVLYVKELAVTFSRSPAIGEKPAWPDDKQAREIMYAMLSLGKQHDVPVVPVYMVSDNPSGTILDLSATFGVDILILGSPHRNTLARLLKGNVVTDVAKHLPENIQLIIYG